MGFEIANRVRQPEYTGENRCMPCTIANLGITIVATLAISYFSPILGIVVLVVSLACIYLRGYLVPGTPTLTKRYFPESVLAFFDKEPPAAHSSSETTPAPENWDTESSMELLLEHDVLEECEQIDDLCLTDEFKHQWQNAIKNSDDETLAHYASSLLNADPSDVTLKTDGGEANRPVFNIDGTVRGNWMSQAAMQADLTAAAALADRLSLWQDLQPNGRAEIIATLRPFLEECPACGGQITMDQETVESCCREFETIIINCQACGDELLNERLND